MIGQNSTDKEIANYGTAEQKIERFENIAFGQASHEEEMAKIQDEVDLEIEKFQNSDALVKALLNAIKSNTVARTMKKEVNEILTEFQYDA